MTLTGTIAVVYSWTYQVGPALWWLHWGWNSYTGYDKKSTRNMFKITPSKPRLTPWERREVHDRVYRRSMTVSTAQFHYCSCNHSELRCPHRVLSSEIDLASTVTAISLKQQLRYCRTRQMSYDTRSGWASNKRTGSWFHSTRHLWSCRNANIHNRDGIRPLYFDTNSQSTAQEHSFWHNSYWILTPVRSR